MAENSKTNACLTEEQKAKTRKISIAEGSASSVMSGAGESYITPYALELQANNIQISLLTSFAGFLGPLTQIYGSKLIEKYNRKKIVFISVVLQATIWLAFILLGFMFLKYGKTPYLIPLFILSFIFYAMFGSLGGPAWFSLMGDVVNEKIRGKYFAKRSKICGTFSIIAAILASVWLYYAREWGIIIIGFMALFAISAVSRYISAYLFTKHHVCDISLKKEYYFSFWQFIKKAPFNNFGRFTIYIALINFAVNISGPFFAVYMWRDLGFNPIWFMAITLSASIFTILFLPFWGKFADKYGNREMMRVGSIFITIVPLFWLFSPNPIYLILIPQLISGIGWSGFNLAASNFIYDAVTVPRRGIVVAYYSVLNGIGVLLGAIVGGIIAQYIHLSFMNIILFIFVISTIARIIVTMLMLPKIKEVKPVKVRKNNPLLYLYEVIPIHNAIKHMLNPLEAMKIISRRARK